MTKEGQEIPSLDGLAYTPQHFIDTGSKMSDVLLALDGHKRPVALKIACVDQRARADVNRLAIKNTIDWLSKLRGYRGIVALRPIEFTGAPWWRSWLTPAIYCAPLQHWPGQPEFLVMEYIQGGSLRDFVGDKRLSLELALWIAHYIARALTYIHQRNCAHRDIKPENILFRTLPEASAQAINSMPLLIDFGVAAAIGGDRLVSGSRLWMAPELQDAYERRPLPVDPSWDVYALGLILCYMLTGRRPRHKNYEIQDYETFRAQTFAVLDRAETSEPRQVTKERVKQLLTKTLDRQPENRPNAQAFATETARLLAELGSPLPLGERLRMRLEQNSRLVLMKQRWLVVVGALLLLVSLCGLAGLAAQRGQLFIGFAVPDDPPTLATAATLSVASLSAANLVTATVPITATVPTTATAPPPPTLAPFTPAAIEPAPTLVPFTAPATGAPPTLVPFTPTSTATDLPPTPTPRPTFTPLPTVTARPSLTPSSTSTRIVTSAVGRVQLLAPASAAHSAESKVLFTWQLTDQPLAPDHCFELVFWDPNNVTDQRSPVGAGKATQRRVDFNLLTSNSDRLLRTLAQSRQNFNWGVRIVSCAKPANILKAVEEVRGYRYDGQ